MLEYFSKKILSRLKPVALPHTLVRKRIYIFPSKSGLVFCAATFMMLLASMNGNNNLGYLVTFFLVSFFVVSIFHTYKNLEGITIQALQVKPVFRNQAASIGLVLNGGLYERHSVQVQLGKSAVQQQALSADTLSRVFPQIVMTERGYHQIDHLKIFSKYPFGLLTAWSYLRPEEKILVYPQPLKQIYQYEVYADSEYHHDGEQVRVKGNDDFSHLREYVAGDSASMISWKSIAKGQGLYTKEFEGLRGTAFLFDFQKIPAGDLEYKLSYLCTLILQADRNRQTYGLVLPGLQIPVGQGISHRNKCLELLARYET